MERSLRWLISAVQKLKIPKRKESQKFKQLTEKIVITKTISVKIDIQNHKEIIKHHKGKFFGTLITWFRFEQAKKEIKAGVMKNLNENLKGRIEKQIDVELSSRLSEEVSQHITKELGENKIIATVIIELARARAQTGFHVAETFPEGELPKRHAEKLAPAGKGFHFIVAVVPPHTAAKLLRVDQVGELGKNKFSGIHPRSLAKGLLAENRIKTSSRSHPVTLTRPA